LVKSLDEHVDNLSLADKSRLIQLLKNKEDLKKFNKFYSFTPYPYQQTFINESAFSLTRFLMAANRCGKSEGAAYELTCHLLGEYPDWWTGRKFDEPIKALAAGVSNSTIRDIMQDKLLGEPTDRSSWGTGFIPKKAIGTTSRKAGVPDALSSLMVKHISGGWSKVVFLSYESGKEAFMGTSYHFVSLDEEPPVDIYSQALRAVTDCNGVIAITATPENGVTDLVRQFTNELKQGQYLQNATWDDAPHLTEEVKKIILDSLPEHERKMRSQGIPVLGSGLIYPVSEEEITCEPFDVPRHWATIAAIDFGYEHPFAWVKGAWDRDEDVFYITDVYKSKRTTPDQHVHEIQLRGGRRTPTAFPQDGLTSEKGTGIVLKQRYAEDLYVLPEPFKNPTDPITGKASNSVEAGLLCILEGFKTGRIKVFQHLEELFKEMRMYHRKAGKIAKNSDDIMDAMRYCIMSKQHAQIETQDYKPYIPYEHDEYYGDNEVGY